MVQLAHIVFELGRVSAGQILLDVLPVATHRLPGLVYLLAIVADGLPLIVIGLAGVVETRFVVVNALMAAVVVVTRARMAVMRQSGRMAIRRAAMMAARVATAMAATEVTATTAADVSAATTATVAATAVRVGQAHRNCQTAPHGHCAQKLPHDAAPYAFRCERGR
jgi:hypothetical protein